MSLARLHSADSSTSPASRYFRTCPCALGRRSIAATTCLWDIADNNLLLNNPNTFALYQRRNANPRTMRLLNVQSLDFHEHYSPIPKYVIASHRWKRGTEASIEDVRAKYNTDKEGFRKVKGFADYVRAYIPHVEWMWIDTCCINQESDRELSEAINSMFKWYRNAEVCLAYLADVETSNDLESFKRSEWFRRGWTLQELLAPRTVVFLTQAWEAIGHKGGSGCDKSGIELNSSRSLTPSIAAVTGIPEKVLNDFGNSNGFAVDEKLKWIAGRETLREEDMSYSLLGILGVNMSVRYGEGGEEARKRILTKVRKEAGAGKQQPAAIQPGRDIPPEPSSNVPFRRDRDFMDRSTLIAGIHKRLALPAGRAALVGLGGAGKSQLAIECTYRVRASLPQKWVFWIHASNAARFEQGMRDVADKVKIDGREDPKANIYNLVRNWLSDGTKGQWMLVLDNVDDASFLVERRASSEEGRGGANACLSLFEYLPVCDHGSILITSRSESAALRLVERSDLIEVNPMDKETAIALLERKLGKQEDRIGVSDLVKTLNYLPLAITQAAAYINQRGRRCSVQQYVEKMRKSDRSMQSILDFDAGDLRRDREALNSIILTWQISFEHIHRIRHSAVELLSLISFCDGQAIPEALIRRRSSKEDRGSEIESDNAAKIKPADNEGGGENEDEEEESSDNSDQSSSIDWDVGSNDGFDDDIAMLEGYSFVSVTTNASVFEMHGLVQLATRKWLESQGQLERWKEQYINNLCSVLPPGRYENWKACQVLFPHAKSAATLKPRNREALLNLATVLYNAAWYALTTGSASDAEEMAAQSLKVRAKELGEDDIETLESMAMVANAIADAGKWKKAEELEVQLMETRKRVLGALHPHTLLSMNSLALTYWNQGRWKEAEELQVQVIGTRKRVLGVENPSTLTNTANLALTYVYQGRWKEAEELQVQVMETQKKALGVEHPSTLTNIGNLALTYMYQGRWMEAEKLGVQLMEIHKKVLGAEHPETLMSISNLASTYRNQGRLEDAERLGVQVVETLKEVLGAEHPDTLTSMHNLASTYRDQGRWKDAEEIGLQVTETRREVLGAEHPYTLTSLSDLASTYWNQGQRKEGEELQVHVMETQKRALGVEHHFTLRSMNNLALIYRDQGRWKDAEELGVQVTKTRRKMLGAEHPDTLRSMANLASTYLNQGQWVKAEKLEVQVMETRKRMLGEEHPDTLTSMINLAHTLKAQAEDQSAYALLRHCASVSSRVLGVEHPLTMDRHRILEEWTQQ